MIFGIYWKLMQYWFRQRCCYFISFCFAPYTCLYFAQVKLIGIDFYHRNEESKNQKKKFGHNIMENGSFQSYKIVQHCGCDDLVVVTLSHVECPLSS